MLKQWLARYPWLPSAVTWLAYAIGVVWRWFHLVIWHDPRKFSLPELEGYVTVAKRLAQPGYVLTVADVANPPGNTWLLELFLRHDPSLLQQVHFNFVVCALVPLAVGALGWVAFGKRTAQAAVVIASGYFGLVDCAAYFTADVHLALVGTLTLASYLQAMKLVAQPPSSRRTAAFFGLAALSGLLFSVAMALSLTALPAILGFCAVHLLFTRGPKASRKALVLAAFLAASAPLTLSIASRCTAANGGHFCRSTNTTEAYFLLGHYDRIGTIEWRDPAKPGEVVTLSNQGALLHGFRTVKVLASAVTDQSTNSEYAWTWIRRNPPSALIVSLEHVWDCFSGTTPWPSLISEQWIGAYAAHFGFIALMLLPALIVLLDLLRERRFVGLLRSTELAVASPMLGVCYAAFVTTGQARHRIPWDGIIILLGVQFYRRMKRGFDARKAGQSIDAVEAAEAAKASGFGEDVDGDRDAEDAQEARRRVRIVGLAAGALAIVGVVYGIFWALPDRHHFRASSGAWGFPTAGLVGTHGDQGLFFHTAEEDHPWVEIDLGDVHEIDRVMVENRDDMGPERAIPLVVEVGDAEQHYHEVARRTEAFDHWTATFARQPARYVRLSVPRKTMFHLKSVQAR
jgi:hypothetical protein